MAGIKGQKWKKPSTNSHIVNVTIDNDTFEKIKTKATLKEWSLSHTIASILRKVYGTEV